tara:strand:+ start:4918 stop:5262 length:345 start_codon:yes stop_codon:yes gene_type:complete
MEAIIVKLMSGETIVADLCLTDERDLTIMNPMALKKGIDEDSNLVIQLVRWIETEQENMKIQRRHIITTAEPSIFLEEYYRECVDRERQDDLMHSADDYESMFEDDTDEHETIH